METQEKYAVAVRPEEALTLQLVAKGLFKSGLFPNAKNEYGAFAITQYGNELGIGPMMALKNINIINGQLAANGQLMLALAMRHGVTFQVLSETNDEVAIKFTRGQNQYTSKFSRKDAEQAGLTGKDNWKKYPKDMLYWRCVAKGLRRIAADAVFGLYTSDEISGGEVVEMEDVQDRESEAQPADADPEVLPDPGLFPEKLPEPATKNQSAKVKKAIEWTLQQGMPVEDVEEAVGRLNEITEDMLPDLKAAYFSWKDSQRQPGEGE